ncbi:hypothetical protein C8R46DRAFT_1037218 [Mycena filopes]|nr:hypothetical protein C8R46DRAFT_1037218 [Mycena filopes]
MAMESTHEAQESEPESAQDTAFCTLLHMDQANAAEVQLCAALRRIDLRIEVRTAMKIQCVADLYAINAINGSRNPERTGAALQDPLDREPPAIAVQECLVPFTVPTTFKFTSVTILQDGLLPELSDVLVQYPGLVPILLTNHATQYRTNTEILFLNSWHRDVMFSAFFDWSAQVYRYLVDPPHVELTFTRRVLRSIPSDAKVIYSLKDVFTSSLVSHRASKSICETFAAPSAGFNRSELTCQGPMTRHGLSYSKALCALVSLSKCREHKGDNWKDSRDRHAHAPLLSHKFKIVLWGGRGCRDADGCTARARRRKTVHLVANGTVPSLPAVEALFEGQPSESRCGPPPTQNLDPDAALSVEIIIGRGSVQMESREPERAGNAAGRGSEDVLEASWKNLGSQRPGARRHCSASGGAEERVGQILLVKAWCKASSNSQAFRSSEIVQALVTLQGFAGRSGIYLP